MVVRHITSETHGTHPVLLDPEDAWIFDAHTWHLEANGRTLYVRTNTRGKKGRHTTPRLHNLVMPGVEVVDHINGNGLDNRKSNLRPVTRLTNSRNARTRMDNTSGFPGVFEARGRWGAKAKVRGTTHHLGTFATWEEAVWAYVNFCVRTRGAAIGPAIRGWLAKHEPWRLANLMPVPESITYYQEAA